MILSALVGLFKPCPFPNSGRGFAEVEFQTCTCYIIGVASTPSSTSTTESFHFRTDVLVLIHLLTIWCQRYQPVERQALQLTQISASYASRQPCLYLLIVPLHVVSIIEMKRQALDLMDYIYEGKS
jgi:hypothetical protein